MGLEVTNFSAQRLRARCNVQLIWNRFSRAYEALCCFSRQLVHDKARPEAIMSGCREGSCLSALGHSSCDNRFSMHEFSGEVFFLLKGSEGEACTCI